MPFKLFHYIVLFSRSLSKDRDREWSSEDVTVRGQKNRCWEEMSLNKGDNKGNNIVLSWKE